jgi:cytochrome c2/nucleotide-binding universal stress UspA family protein
MKTAWVIIILAAATMTPAAQAQDAAAGQKVFGRCRPCHSIGPGAKNKLGPELNGLDGRHTGSVPGYSYSAANRKSGIVWGEKTFKKYIRNPQRDIPGTKMMFAGLDNQKDINDLWAYLKQFGPDGKKKWTGEALTSLKAGAGTVCVYALGYPPAGEAEVMIKDVVVNIGLNEKNPAAEFAISIGETFDAHVLGVAFAYEPIVPYSASGAVPSEFIEAQRADSDRNARSAIERFEQATKRAGISYESLVLNASVSGASDQLGRIARRFDAVVLAQPTHDKPMPDEVIDEGVLFESGRPVIFVPFIQKGGIALDRVMVCWDGGRTATRAIADSLPFLQKAKQVEVVVIGNKPPKSDEVPGADIGQHLARHGLKVDVKRITISDIDVPSTILSHAADSSADLIVMGGYGHSRLREFVLGGATRGLLEAMTVPVLMSH